MAASAPNCLRPEDLVALTQGAAGHLLDHVASCDSCAARLRAALSIDSAPTEEELEEERALQAHLGRETPEWRAAIASRLASKRPRSRWSAARLLPWAATFLAVIGGLVGWNVWRNPLRQSETLLAQAYSERRQFEWRLPDAGWAEFATERRSDQMRPAPLAEAQALLTRTGAADPRSVELQARAHLLDSRLDNALAVLERAGTPGSSPRLLTTIAVANALRAERGDFPAGYAAVIEYTTRALAADPRDRVALYNQALAFEKLNVVPRAIESWTRYLAVETDAGWKKEAETHLAALRDMVQQRDAARQRDDFSERVFDGADGAAFRWLVDDRAKARAAGEALREKSGDRWLAAAAEETADSRPLRDFFALVQQVKPDQVLAQGPGLMARYASAPAHQAWIRYEVLRAHRHKLKIPECLALATPLEADARQAGFHWIAIRALAERGGCQRYGGDLGGADAARRKVIELARAQKLDQLADDTELRTLTLRTADGDVWTAWQGTRDLLGRFAASGAPPDSLQRCLYQYAESAEKMGWFAAAYQFARTGAEMLTGVREAGNRAKAASLALAAGLDRDAQAELDRIDQLKDAIHASDLAGDYDRNRRRLLSAVAFERGHYQEVVNLLTPVDGAGLIQQDRWQVHRLLGSAAMRLGQDAIAFRHLAQATSDLNRAVATQRRAERSYTRRQGWAGYRDLARLQIRQGQPDAALGTWIGAHGSEQAPDLVILGLDDGYAVWYRKAFQQVKADRDSVRTSLRRLLAHLADPRSSIDEIQRDARAVFSVLALRPGSGRVRILPDEEWAAFPFTLVFDGAVTLAPAPAPGLDPRLAAPWAKPRRVLAVGASQTREPLPILADARKEAAAVAARWPESRLLDGAQATTPGILSALPGVDLFHFAGHGYAAGGLGGLHTADGPLTSVALRGLDLASCRLAVLSACLTGVGESTGLLNPDTLVHAFLDAGVRTVVASRWNLDSASTHQVVSFFYDRLAAGHPPDAALHLATHSVRQTPRFAHPYYWAGLQIYE